MKASLTASAEHDAKSQAWDDHPLQQRREAGRKEGKHRRRRGVGPASPDCDIEPLTEQGIGERGERRSYKLMVRKRSALVTTSTELMLMAALAIMGLSSKPSAG